MCILFVCTDPNPQKGNYRLVLASNRDEEYKRPAMPAHIDTITNIIGGKDMTPGKEKGTWLAYKSKDKPNGKGTKYCVSSLLNITGEKVENPCGRGHIITNYLISDKNFPEYVNELNQTVYDGFNFITVELSKDNTNIYHHSNMPKITSSYNGKHILGFGNSPTFSPLQKVASGRFKFEEILNKKLSGVELEKELLKLLKDETRYLPDKELQTRQPLHYELLSSIFVKFNPPVYGTRTHTLILVDYDWNFQFIEHTLENPTDDNLSWKETRINLTL